MPQNSEEFIILNKLYELRNRHHSYRCIFFSAGTFVAWGSIAYKYGWVAVTIQWTMCIGGLVTGLYIAPKWKGTGNLTGAEFIKDRLGENVQKGFIYIFMLVWLFIKGSVLYSVSKLVGSSLEFPLIPVTSWGIR
nr:hypothetical protein [Pedobacter sp. N36a]